MSTQPLRWLALVASLAVVGIFAVAAQVVAQDPAPGDTNKATSDARIELSRRSGRQKTYPCTQCHKPGFKAQLEGQPATHRNMAFKHFDGIKKCTMCHDIEDPSSLKLTNGKRASLDHSYKLCGQCHGEKLRDWQSGSHGKHVGSWQNKRIRLLCTDCHNPHSPAFAQEEAHPAPPFPKFGIPKKGGH